MNEANVDGWSALSDRHERDLLREFAEFVDQVELATQLLNDGSRGRARTALTELHSLADILLYRRAHARFHLSDGGGTEWHHALTVTRPERRDVERSFSRRVSLATETLEVPFGGHLEPLLRSSDAEIFRIAHAYRNRAYHRGEQNPTTLPLVARIFTGALARAWSMSQPPIGVERRRWDAVIGSIFPEGSSPPGGPGVAGFVQLDAAAAAFANRLAADAAISDDDVRETLVEDLLERAAAAEALSSDLADDGFARDRQMESMAWADMLDSIGNSPEVVEIEMERRELASKIVAAREIDEGPEPELYRAYVDLQGSHASHVFGTWRTWRRKRHWTVVEQMPSKAARLRSRPSLASVLQLYRRLDEELDSVERRLWELARGWDDYLDMEMERERGN